jgi:hypothetical protein
MQAGRGQSPMAYAQYYIDTQHRLPPYYDSTIRLGWDVRGVAVPMGDNS